MENNNTNLELTNKINKKNLKKTKFYVLFITFILLFILTLSILVTIVIKTNVNTFLELSKEMLKNEPSIVITSDGTTIAQIRW